MKKLKKYIFLSPLLLWIFLWGQARPTSQIIDFNASVKGILIGAAPGEHCYFWFHSPTPTQTQIACFVQNGVVVKNEIINSTITMNGGIEFPDGTIQWIITSSTYEFSARALGDSTDKREKGTY